MITSKIKGVKMNDFTKLKINNFTLLFSLKFINIFRN